LVEELRENDRNRQNELEIAGWRMLRFNSRALKDEPARVAGQVARMLDTLASPDAWRSAAPQPR